MARRKPRKKTYDPLAPLSPRMLQLLIGKSVNASLAPGRAEINRQRQAAQQQADTDVQRQHDAAAGLAALLGQTAGTIKNDYAGASGAAAAFGKGFADLQQGGQQADAAQAAHILGIAGAPQSQVEQVGGQNSHVGATSYALNGALPANLLNTQGAAAVANARLQPGFALQQGLSKEAAIRSAERLKEKDLDQALQDLMGKVPGLRLDEYKQLIGIELQKQAARTQNQYLGIAGDKQALDVQATLDPNTGLPYSYINNQNDNAAALQAAKIRNQKSGAKATHKEQLAARKARTGALSANHEKAYGLAVHLAQQGQTTKEKFAHVQKVSREQAYSMLYERYGQPLEQFAPRNARQWWLRQIQAMVKGAVVYAYGPAPKKKRNPRPPAGARGPVG